MRMMTANLPQSEVQVKFKTFQEEYSVPDTVLTVPSSIDGRALTDLIRNLLEEANGACLTVEKIRKLDFDFILWDEFLREDLTQVLSARGSSFSPEDVIEITYIEKLRPPKPRNSVNHDDWVSGVAASLDYVLSSCYDNTVSIWDKDSGAKLLTIPAHTGPCRAVAWISVDKDLATFASASHDQTVLLHEWNISKNSIERVNALKGHERSVDCVTVDPTATLLGTGSYDAQLKIWGASLATVEGDVEDQEGPEESNSKRAKVSSSFSHKAVTRTPIMTLAGHREGISGVTWMASKGEVCTSSWDHTLRIWDVEMGGMKSELVGNKSFFDVSYSSKNNLLVTAAAERCVRLYDPKSNDGVLVKSAYSSHGGWVTCVDWCDGSDIHFVSGSHDMVLKLWDLRSFKVPLFDLSGHSDRILCCDWSQRDTVVSGGVDNDMKVFKTNM